MEEEKSKKIVENSAKVIAEFDFVSVQKHMKQTNHTWKGEIPNLHQLQFTAEFIMKRALYMATIENKPAVHTGTGGFNVYIFPEWDGVKLTYEPREFQKASY